MIDCLYKDKKCCAFDMGFLVLSQKNSKSFGGKNLCRLKPDFALQKSRYFLILCYSNTESKNSKSFGGKNPCRFEPDLALQKSRYFF